MSKEAPKQAETLEEVIRDSIKALVESGYSESEARGALDKILS